MKQWVSGLKPIYKYGVLAAIIIAIAVVVVLQSQPQKTKPLYTNLDSRDSKAIVKELVSANIDYEMQDNGATIMIDSSQIAQVRLRLASQGLPREGSPGFELLDQTNIGETKYDKDRKYERALKGQLEHDLSEGVDGVENATVTLSLNQQNSIFENNQNHSKATVMLRLGNNVALNESQIKGVQNFVSGAVRNLKSEEVVVLDDKGTMLSGTGGADGEKAGLTGNLTKQEQIVSQTESRIKDDIMKSLSKVFGYDHVTLNVRATINFDEIISNKELYEPGVLVSRHRTTEHAEKNDGQGKQTPGVETNGTVPNYEVTDKKTGQVLLQNKDEVIENFEVGKTVDTLRKNPSLTNLSVAVWIDNDLSQNEIDKMKKAVATSAGLVDKNEDGKLDNGEVEIVPVFFNQNLNKDDAAKDKKDDGVFGSLLAKDNLKTTIIYSVILGGILLLLLAIFIGRKRKKEKEEMEQMIAVANEETEREETIDEKIINSISKHQSNMKERVTDEESISRQRELNQKAIEVAETDPKKTSEYIRRMINEDF